MKLPNAPFPLDHLPYQHLFRLGLFQHDLRHVPQFPLEGFHVLTGRFRQGQSVLCDRLGRLAVDRCRGEIGEEGEGGGVGRSEGREGVGVGSETGYPGGRFDESVKVKG